MICGNCRKHADTVEAVRACYDNGDPSGCFWMVQVGANEVDGSPLIEDCGAHVIRDERGWHCEAGHGHTNMEVRHAEGWDYSESDGEDEILAKYGTQPMPIAYGG